MARSVQIVLALMVMCFVGCGPTALRFEGEWKISSGKLSSNCKGNQSSQSLIGTVRFDPGPAGTLVATDSNGCISTWVTNQNILVLQSSKGCLLLNHGTTEEFEWTDGTATLDLEGDLHISESGAGTVGTPTGTNSACTADSSFTATKING
jgi:hypothetical protein